MMKMLKSEYLKIGYNKWLVTTAFLTIILVPMFIIYLHESPSDITKSYVFTQLLESFYLAQAGIMVFSILYIGQEFSRSTLRTSAILCPNRLKLLMTKLLALLSLVVLIWSFLCLFTVMVVTYYYGLLIDKEMFTIILEGAIVSFSLAMICFSLVVLSRSLLFSMGISLSFLLGLGQLLLQFSPLLLYFPILSTMNLFLLVPSSVFLPSYHGLIVQYVWAIVLFISSSWLFMRREMR